MDLKEFFTRCAYLVIFWSLLSGITYIGGSLISADWSIPDWGFYARGGLGWLWYVIALVGTFLICGGGYKDVFK